VCYLTTTTTSITIAMTSMNSQDPFNQNPMWGNTPSNSKGATSFDDVARESQAEDTLVDMGGLLTWNKHRIRSLKVSHSMARLA
jgi:hypothetical protein